MGRIKTQITKTVSKKLIEENPDTFETNFEQNKKKLETKANFNSKKLRNTIAGYITRLIKEQQKKN